MIPEIYFDEYSELIGDDIDSLQQFSGTSVVIREQFLRALRGFGRECFNAAREQIPMEQNAGLIENMYDNFDDYLNSQT